MNRDIKYHLYLDDVSRFIGYSSSNAQEIYQHLNKIGIKIQVSELQEILNYMVENKYLTHIQDIEYGHNNLFWDKYTPTVKLHLLSEAGGFEQKISKEIMEVKRQKIYNYLLIVGSAAALLLCLVNVVKEILYLWFHYSFSWCQ